ncbi:hypothetical protein HBI79_137990 [Parastagonospora nodorum]|nr:hypothetical protein HBI79_137990 [Parastagonospora nodorum]
MNCILFVFVSGNDSVIQFPKPYKLRPGSAQYVLCTQRRSILQFSCSEIFEVLCTTLGPIQTRNDPRAVSRETSQVSGVFDKRRINVLQLPIQPLERSNLDYQVPALTNEMTLRKILRIGAKQRRQLPVHVRQANPGPVFLCNVLGNNLLIARSGIAKQGIGGDWQSLRIDQCGSEIDQFRNSLSL